MRTGGGGFGPASLFAAGEKGGMIAPSRYSTTMWQDVARTTPAVVGQTVASAQLVYSNPVTYVEQATAAKRPTLVLDDAGRPRLLFDAAQSQELVSPGNMDLSGTAAVSIFCAGGSTTNTIQSLVKFGDVTTTVGSFDLGTFSGGLLCYRKGSGSFGGRGTPSFTPLKFAASVVLNLAGNTQATENPTFRVNGVDQTLTNYGTADSGTGNFGNNVVYFGSGQGFLAGYLYDTIIRGALSSAAEITNVENYLNAQLGFTSLTVFPTSFADSAALINNTKAFRTSTFAQAVYTTTATAVTVTFDTPLFATPNFGEIGVYVNGAFNQSIPSTFNGENIKNISLPAGSKTVSFVNGLESAPAAVPLGSFVSALTPNATLTPATPTPTNRVLVYGDSIASGGNATVPTQSAWPMIVRTAYGSNSLAVESYGFRSLIDDCTDATARAAFVAKVVAYAPARLWIAIGTNDYGLNKQTAAAFGTMYAALLDDLHTALPSLLIWCQTPLSRSVETANGLGSTLPNYRTQIATVQSTRSAYATLVDGTAIMTTASLDDGLHPTTAGHALYAAFVRTALSI